MMKRIAILTVLTLAATAAWAGDTKSEHLERASKAAEVFKEMSNMPEKGIPQSVLDGAQCVAVVPNMFKAGFIIGGRHGEGVATCKLSETRWSAPAFFTVSGGSFGAQIGGQSTDLVLMIMNEEGMNQLLQGKFELGGNVSAAAGPVGRQAGASAGWGAAILTYSRAKGAFIGATFDGAVFNQDEDATEDVYGREVPAKDILMGKVKFPAGAPQLRAFVNTVSLGKAKTEGDTDFEVTGNERDDKADLPASDRDPNEKKKDEKKPDYTKPE
jgi:lipid-binding SYLF domain-containing protein